MPIGNWNLDWLSHNSQRAYPLAHDATRRDTTDSFEIPNDFIVELDLPVSAGMEVEPARFFLRRLGAFSTGYSIIVGYDGDEGEVNVATALIPRDGHEQNTTYNLAGIGDFIDTLGSVTISNLDSIDLQPAGFYSFTLADTRLDVDAVRPYLRGVTSLTVVTPSGRSLPLTGDIELVAGANFQLLPVLVEGEDPVIRFSAIEGEGTVEDCVCEGEGEEAVPIRRINGVAPTSDGDFHLLGSPCLEITAITNGLQITDTCSQPCCGCSELEPITAKLRELLDEVASLRSFLAALAAAAAQADQLFLGLRLRDQACFECE